MSKKTIVLADSSYTIRRIVELSFSEEKDIELFTFENSLNLREKLLELQPHVVLIDVKLPEFNGYEVCQFVQETESLKHTKVFLLKGGFEPIDENLLEDLRYVDIITKPFDSNALVSNIKKLLDEMDAPAPPSMPDEIPSSLPEDLSEISGMPEDSGDISFSDVKDEVDSTGLLGDEELERIPGPYSEEEILPSEEITRAQPEKDSIAPGDDLEVNPFEEEMAAPEIKEKEGTGSLTEEELNIKRNIELQEKELEIGSLTVEEVNIKKQLEERQKQELDQEEALVDIGGTGLAEEPEDETSEMFPDTKLDTGADVSEEKPVPKSPMASPESAEPAGVDQLRIMSEPEPGLESGVSSVPAQEEPVGQEMEMGDDLFAFGTEVREAPPEPAPATEAPSFETPGEEESLFAQEEMPEIKYEQETASTGIMDMDLETPSAAAGKEEPLIPAEESLITAEEPQPPEPESFVTRKIEMADTEVPPEPEPEPEVEEIVDLDSMRVEETEPEFALTPEPEPVPKPEAELTDFQDAREYEVPPMAAEPAAPPRMEEVAKPPEAPEPIPPVPEAAAPPLETGLAAEKVEPETPVPDVSTAAGGEIKEEEILRRVEDKMTNAIKEMLWEIVPPIAEKIIKKEIETLKLEAEKSLD